MKGEFVAAVHAIVFLNHSGKSMTSEEIAASVCTNSARIRKIMGKLKCAGLISTREGAAHGGYTYLGDPQKTTLLEIFHAVDDKIVSGAWKSGSSDLPCLIASGMADVMDEIFDRMDDACLELLGKITVADIDQKIFGAGPDSK